MAISKIKCSFIAVVLFADFEVCMYVVNILCKIITNEVYTFKHLF